jgi:hypothetical protein
MVATTIRGANMVARFVMKTSDDSIQPQKGRFGEDLVRNKAAPVPFEKAASNEVLI